MSGMILVLAAGLAAQEPPPEIVKFQLVRERVGHRVLASLTVRNRGQLDLADLRVMLVYYDGDRELRRSDPGLIARLTPGMSADLKIEAKQVEKFSRYLLVVEHARGGHLFTGTDANAKPVAKPPDPAKLSLVAPRIKRPDSFPGDVVVAMTVRNTGDREAEEPVAVVTFKGRGDSVMHVERVRLSSGIRPGFQDAFQVRIPAGRSYVKAEAAVIFVQEVGPSWQEPPVGNGAVNVRKSRLSRMTDGSVRVTGVIHNGRPGAISDVVVKFEFGPTVVPLRLSGTIPPDGRRRFEVFVPGRPKFNGAGYSLSFGTGASKRGAEPARSTAIHLGSRRIFTISRAKVPEPAKRAPEEAPVKRTGPAVSVGIRGFSVLDGVYQNNGKYTGDVLFVRFVCFDPEGKRVQPIGKLNAVIYDAKKPVWKSPRTIRKTSWAKPVSRLTGANVRHDTIAYDKKTGELYVALFRTRTEFYDFQTDVKLEVKGIGSWTWRGLKLETTDIAPRGPDKKD